VRWLVTASGPWWGLRGCRQDDGDQGSCLHLSGSDSAVGGPACSALCSHVRPMLLGTGLCGAGRAHAAAGAAACAGPGRAVTGGVHWGVRSVWSVWVRALPRRGLHCRVSAGRVGSGWASGAEEAWWVGECLPGAGGGHWGAHCCWLRGRNTACGWRGRG